MISQPTRSSGTSHAAGFYSFIFLLMTGIWVCASTNFELLAPFYLVTFTCVMEPLLSPLASRVVTSASQRSFCFNIHCNDCIDTNLNIANERPNPGDIIIIITQPCDPNQKWPVPTHLSQLDQFVVTPTRTVLQPFPFRHLYIDDKQHPAAFL